MKSTIKGRFINLARHKWSEWYSVVTNNEYYRAFDAANGSGADYNHVMAVIFSNWIKIKWKLYAPEWNVTILSLDMNTQA